MKKTALKGMTKLVVFFSLIYCQNNFANQTGLFFNVTASGPTIFISTTVPNHVYPIAGIKINTPGYTIISGCSPISNGYCEFSVSDTAPAILSVNGPAGTLSITLCLNAPGPVTCQNYTLGSASLIFVGDINTNNVMTFPANGNGNIAPLFNLNGSNTGNNQPYDLYLDAAHKLWVSNYASGTPIDTSVTQFTLPANGNTTPQVNISGTNTTFIGPTGLGKDALGNIYVADFNNNSIDVFAPGSNGNVSPIRQIIGGLTQINEIESMVVTPEGIIYVANSGAPNLLEFAAGSNGNVAPIRVISSTSFSVEGPDGLWIDIAGNFWVTDFFNNSILEFSPDANGLSTPIRTISGANTNINKPYGVAVDTQGNIYEVGIGYSGINVFSPSAAGNATPVQTIFGSNTLLSAPAGLTIK